jgi:hypothetical protein
MIAVAAALRRWGVFWALALALSASIGAGGALPWIARALSGPAAHFCHCSTHFDCLCARCHPDDEGLRFSDASIKGQCGDDEAFAVGKAFTAIVPPPLGVPVALGSPSRPPPPSPALTSALARPPPTPPPRS